MLGEAGCRLPMQVRPLVCRLHPYVYTATGISGIDQSCLIAKELDWTSVMQQLGMAIDTACQWHQLLYCELHEENLTASYNCGEASSFDSEKITA